MPHFSAHDLLQAYDAQLRDEAEVRDASWHDKSGPVYRARFADRGFITASNLSAFTGTHLDAVIEDALSHFRDHTDVAEVEWKTRSHDVVDSLTARLVAAGFERQDTETVMMGPTEALAKLHLTPLPDGVTVRRAQPGDGEAMHDLTGHIFGKMPGLTGAHFDAQLRSGSCYFIVTQGDHVVGSARAMPVVDTDFVGLWGGCIHPDWRGKRLYGHLVARRAEWALDEGYPLAYSDCLPTSRPLMERAGLVPVTKTTPYIWYRQPQV